MNSTEFESLKKKIEILKEKQAKASGAIESIVAAWKEAYGLETLEEVEAKLEEEKASLAEAESFLEEQYTELKGLTQWGLV